MPAENVFSEGISGMRPILPPLFRPGAGPEGAMLDPSDPVTRWSGCYYGHEDEESAPVYVRSPHGTPRAAIQRMTANDWDCDFRDVQVLARWGRILTRQDCWDAYGREDWTDLWLHKHKVGYYFQPAAYYYDAEVGAADNAFGNLTPVQVPTPPAEPPAEWCPREDKPVWELCSPSAPGATPIYISEAMR